MKATPAEVHVIFGSAYDAKHGVVNMRQVIDDAEDRGELARILTDVAAGGPRQKFFAAAVDGLRGLAQQDLLTRKQATVLMSATERLAELAGDEEIFRTLAVLAVSPTAAPVVLDYAARSLETRDDAARWLAFTAVGEVLKHGTAPIGEELFKSLERAAGKEGTDRRAAQYRDIINQIRTRYEVAPQQRLKGLSVLVVDDDETFLNLVSLTLKRSGADVLTAATVKNARLQFREKRPSCVVTDIWVEEPKSGINFVRYIRNQLHDQTPVIGITGKNIDEKSIQTAGFSALLRKPLDMKVLPGIIVAETENTVTTA